MKTKVEKRQEALNRVYKYRWEDSKAYRINKAREQNCKATGHDFQLYKTQEEWQKEKDLHIAQLEQMHY